MPPLLFLNSSAMSQPLAGTQLAVRSRVTADCTTARGESLLEDSHHRSMTPLTPHLFSSSSTSASLRPDRGRLALHSHQSIEFLHHMRGCNRAPVAPHSAGSC